MSPEPLPLALNRFRECVADLLTLTAQSRDYDDLNAVYFALREAVPELSKLGGIALDKSNKMFETREWGI